MIDEPESLQYIRPVRLLSHDVLFATALTLAAIVFSGIAVLSNWSGDQSMVRSDFGDAQLRDGLPLWPGAEVSMTAETDQK